jgi:prepilin-type N-terminal cleavage/methylation domain-containing protein
MSGLPHRSPSARGQRRGAFGLFRPSALVDRRSDRVPLPADGFSLLEVLAALLILVLLLTAASHSLITSLRAETLTRSVERAPLIMRRTACEYYLTGAATSVVAAARADGDILMESAIQPGESFGWQEWTLSPADRPSLRIQWALRAAPAP